jgi:ubiquinone/menaquinone biosynthesis C-methylase UbiE
MEQKKISDNWERGDRYERFMGRWSRRLAPLFLSWLGYPAEKKWLDVGCGTGALSAAVLDHCSPLFVAGLEPSKGFLKAAKENLAERVGLYQGSSTQIPLAASTVDVVVSGLVLNFITDPHAALVEMARVTNRGGTIGSYVWDYAEKMEFLRLFWDAAAEQNPGEKGLDEGIRFPLCNPEALKKLFASAGLKEIEVKSINIETPFVSFDDYWQPFLGGQGSAPSYVAALDDAEKDSLREGLRLRLPIRADGSISLAARAWAIRAQVG